MSMLEVRLIIDNVVKYGGFREKDILDHLLKVELIQNDDKHKVYRFANEENYFDYDFRSHLIVG